ncbi:UNKNOWN [Stylonychia lemnae]|uniref:Multi-sensor hybrid histidine kinase n=1 Tax=Stylonychia lemnae TaxID=5949 RepID=A0A078ABB8_STYLE|nr:UNKNOWN [Stylonychia lemnae]|eukprot:CDW79459.1 UNKNOWN [Stylonychia lemnae]
MNSKVFLRIKDPELSRKFSLSRNKEILKSCMILLALRMVNLSILVSNVVISKQETNIFFWFLRIFGICWQIVVMALGYCFPIAFNQIYSLLIVPSFLVNIVPSIHIPANSQLLVANIITYSFFQSIGILLNNNWMLTTLGMIINYSIISGFYIHYFGQVDFSIHWLLFATFLVSALTCYHFEKRLKQQFIQLYQIRVMNDELKQIFDKIPEGILLFNETNKKIALTNLEFTKLFQCQEEKDYGELEKLISDVKLRRYHLQQSDNQNQFGSRSMKPYLNLFEASNGDYQDECFEILTKSQVLMVESNNIQNDHSNFEIVSISQCQIHFQGFEHSMILIKNLTPVVKYEKLKVENHYYEMLTATVSHDMRTPLNAIIGLLGNLESFVVHQGKRFLPIIQNSSKFMLFLVNDLLDFFQIKNGQFRRNENTVNLRKSIRDLIDMFKVGAQEKGIQLLYFCQDDFPSQLKVDDSRIQQVLLNLLQNALKFTFEGTISVLMKFSQSNNEISISVSDSGIGIKSDEREKLFQMFGKLKTSSAINTSGIGIGLIICKKIVEAFDGHIILEEQDPTKQGTTFTFSIKIRDDQSDSIQEINRMQGHQNQDLETFRSNHNLLNNEARLELQDQDVSRQNSAGNIFTLEGSVDSPTNFNDIQIFSTDLKTKTDLNALSRRREQCPQCRDQVEILIVDDHIFNIVTLQTILEIQFNLKVHKAMNGLEAVQKVRERINDTNGFDKCREHYSRNYKLILMDGNMPIMDGLQATQEIRLLEQMIQIEQESQGPYRPNKSQRSTIVCVTAYDTESFKQRCFASGMDYFQIKPITPQILEPYINRYLK